MFEVFFFFYFILRDHNSSNNPSLLLKQQKEPTILVLTPILFATPDEKGNSSFKKNSANGNQWFIIPYHRPFSVFLVLLGFGRLGGCCVCFFCFFVVVVVVVLWEFCDLAGVLSCPSPCDASPSPCLFRWVMERGKRGKEKGKGKEKDSHEKKKEKEETCGKDGSNHDGFDVNDRSSPGSSKGLGVDSNPRLFGRFGKKLKKTRTEEEEYAREMKRRAKLCVMTNPEATSSNCTVSGHFRSDKPLANLWFYAESFDDLPPDLHESIRRMKADPEVLANNFTTLLNVLSFADKHVPRRRFDFFYSDSFLFFLPLPCFSYPQIPFSLKICCFFQLFSIRFVTHAQFARMKKLKTELPQTTLPKDRLLSPEKAYQTVSLVEARSIVRWDNYLGHGGFGQVVKGKCRDKNDKNYGKKVAVKFVPNKSGGEKQKNLAEVSFLNMCNHPNIVKAHQVLEVRNEIWITMELLRGGNLKQASSSKISPFDEREIAFISREILKGLEYLHSINVAHRDLKSLNVMLTVDGTVKLVDFGLAVDMSAGPRVGLVGSPEFLAPEMIRGEFYSYPVDIWSFVICILELANQKPREKGNVKRAMFTTATRGLSEPRFSKPGSWSSRFKVFFFFFFFFPLVLGVFVFFCFGTYPHPPKDFIDLAGTFSPLNRPTATELLQHKFMQSACSQKAMKEKLTLVWYLNGHGGGQR